jgi:hypothetical protein
LRKLRNSSIKIVNVPADIQIQAVAATLRCLVLLLMMMTTTTTMMMMFLVNKAVRSLE